MSERVASVASLLSDVRHVGRDRRRGGYSRSTFTASDLELREWFVAEADRRGFDVQTDRNGAVWAWRPRPDGSLEHAVVTGSHLDSVPGGGEFDGPLGIASALAAVDLLDAEGATYARPLAVVVFPEEEGARFGQACLGSELMTGGIARDRALGLRDDAGITLAEAMTSVGIDPVRVGRDDEAIGRMGAFVELHVEQGIELAVRDQPVGIGASIIGHGLWRLVVTGQGNHAGATLMNHRRDPMVAASAIVVAVRDAACAVDGARATVGKVQAVPGGTNAIPSRVDVWVDVRHPDDAMASLLVASIHALAREAAAAEGCDVLLVEESYAGPVRFDGPLRDRIASVLPAAPVLESGAGHDAGVLAGVVPTAMLFTRNPTGVSHSPQEQIDDSDGEAGAAALADVLRELLRP